jgi:homoserine dehydrogenase
MMPGKRISVGLIGYGTVGQGVAAVLERNRATITERLGCEVRLKTIVEKFMDRKFDVPVPADATMVSDVQALIEDKEITVAIELVGGTTFAKDLVIKLLNSGKHVVTANKALLAHYGQELFALARKNGVSIGFEASCAGGIPVIEAIRRGLAANDINAIYGIVNGTCNYILTAMTREHKSYAVALKEAQVAGFAEADPTLDVNGTDSAHKLAILSSLCFAQAVPFESISIEGIDTVSVTDLNTAAELGYVMKLLAIGVKDGDGVSVRVHPAFIRTTHPLAWVSGSFNAVCVYGNAVGHTMFYGRGAGRMPTASAVVADVMDIALGNAVRTFAQVKVLPDVTPTATMKPIDSIVGRYYLRLMVSDRPGVVAAFAEVFGKHGISLSAVLQREGCEKTATGESIVPVVVLTHEAQEGNVRRAIDEIAALGITSERPACIRVIDEHAEWS